MKRASDIAYDKIKRFVLSGDAEPGAQLTEDQLARISGVSRTPVREAVRRLESELLVVRNESKRLFVADWSDSDIEELFTMRAMLESHGAARAADRIDAQQIAELEAISDTLEGAIAGSRPNVAEFLRCNRRFHDLVLEAAESPRLNGMLAILIEQQVVYRTAHRYRRAELEQSARDHRELIEAFKAADANWARAIMTSHIRRAFHIYSSSAARATPAPDSAND